MAGKVISITGDAAAIPGETSGEIVELLREALAEAERGEVVAVAVAMVRPNNATDTGFQWDRSAAALLGAVTLLQADIIRKFDAG